MQVTEAGREKMITATVTVTAPEQLLVLATVVILAVLIIILTTSL